MDKETALFIVVAAMKHNSALANMPMAVRSQLDDVTYNKLIRDVAYILADTSERIINPIYEQYPDIRSELEHRIERFGAV